jgi:TonB family protein
MDVFPEPASSSASLIASTEGFISPVDRSVSMRVLVALAALSAAFVLVPAATGFAPAWSQDFSITNPDVPADGSRRDVMRQLQAWWDVHAYYPTHASRNDEGGTVRVHLEILRDGRIWSVRVVSSSGSPSLDAAAFATFTGGFVRPFPEGAAGMELDIPLHYVLAHRHDQPVPVDYQPVSSHSPFTIANDPVKSPILEKMLQKTCTGKIVINAIRNHPSFGIFYDSTLVFFRRPDGTPWVKFYEVSHMSMSAVTQVGKLLSWTGPMSGGPSAKRLNHYTAWLDDDNKLKGCISTDDTWQTASCANTYSGALEFTCADDVVPQIEFDAMYMQHAGLSWDPP